MSKILQTLLKPLLKEWSFSMKRFNNLVQTTKGYTRKLVNALNNAQDTMTEKLNDAKKTKFGKTVTYIMGGNPEADKALEYQKHDLPKDTDNNVVEKLDEFLGKQKGE